MAVKPFIVEDESTITTTLKSGRAGNLQTLAAMKALALKYAAHPNVRKLAITLTFRFRQHEKAEKIAALYEFVRDRIHWTADPVTVGDRVQNPLLTLQRRYGDCVDQVVLLASLLGSVGYVSRFSVLSYQPPAFQHVYLEVKTENGNWLPLDPTNDLGVSGERPRGLLYAYYPVFEPGDANDPNNIGWLNYAISGATMGIGLLTNKAKVRGAEEQARDEMKEQTYAQLAQILSAVENNQMTGREGRERGQQAVGAYYTAVGAFKTDSVKKSAENYRSAFAERLAKIDSAAQAQSAKPSGPAGSLNPFPSGQTFSPLMIAGGAVLLLLLLR